MRRFKLFTVALIAVVAVVLSVSAGALAGTLQPGPQLPYRISDSFNGSSLNPAVWYTEFQDPGTTQTVHNGSLWLTASSATSPSGFGDGIETNCQAVGDFNAQMSFTLSTWPAGDNVGLLLYAPGGGNINTGVFDNVGGDIYELFVNPASEPAGFGSSVIPRLSKGSGGELLLSRRGAVSSAYFRDSNATRWHQIGQFSGSTNPTSVGPDLYSGAFGGQPVSVQVNSFELDAAGLSC